MLRPKGDRRLFDSGLKPPFVSLTKSEDMKMMDWHTYRQKFMRNTILAVYLRRFVVRRWLQDIMSVFGFWKEDRRGLRHTHGGRN